MLLADLLVATGNLTVTRHTFKTVFGTFERVSKFLSNIGTKVQTLTCSTSSTLLHSVLTTRNYPCVCTLILTPYVLAPATMLIADTSSVLAGLCRRSVGAIYLAYSLAPHIGVFNRSYLRLLYVNLPVPHHPDARTSLLNIALHVAPSGSARRAL